MQKPRMFLIGSIIAVGIISIFIFWIAPKDRYHDMADMKNEEDGIVDNSIPKLNIDGNEDDEELIMKIITARDGEEYLAKALELLPNIDFDRLEHVYGEGSVLELLEWLSERRIEGEANIMVLIDMADEFYREESSKFAEIIANTYRLDKLKFIRALAKTPEKVNIMTLALHELRVYD
ncbi:MAG: hypothetical protein GX329_02105, partial [Tissierellia bacterium]|nr:hypothetical protein [Tissierellia bacterium]